MTESIELTDEEISEYRTRKVYIDKELRDLGWKENRDWINEMELHGMPNASSVGYADYVLLGDDGRPLAVIEAKRSTKSIAIGRHQAQLYADILERQYGRRPVVFLTNGFDTHIMDEKNYQERKVSGLYCKRDLEKLFNLASNRSRKLSDAVVNDSISNRYYQKGAIRAVCTAFENKHRKALIVMATGSGKTRTVISLVDVMLRKGWVRNVLFLADRTSLVSQAYEAFVDLLPSLSSTNLCSSRNDVHARCVFSTYQTMINLIDTVREDDNTRTFSNGHFDLIIVDEAHRSIYNKYQAIFDYFDGLLVGLTATPKDEIDKNTYEVFNLGSGDPTYNYGLAEAVSDGYLVDFMSVEVQMKFMQRGVIYAELPPEERDEYENMFLDGVVPERIESSEINKWVFNRDTIVKVLDQLMRLGLKVDDGSRIGKTIIFAKNHLHAEKILQVFNEQYPSFLGMCEVMDYQTRYVDDSIRKFKQQDSKVRIAVSVDMLDTGIDVPDILNLVFFKPVYSKAKFWQMIGRGTRLCPGLIDGRDKDRFYIFDFCGNFDFFRVNPKGVAVHEADSIQGRIFSIKARLAYELQSLRFQAEPYVSFRSGLVDDLLAKVRELNRDNFAVRQHLRAVERYSRQETYMSLSEDDVITMQSELSSLILPYPDDSGAVRFDALMLAMEAGLIEDEPAKNAMREVRRCAEAVSRQTVIPEVAARIDTIKLVMKSGYLESTGLEEQERIRLDLRDLMKYIVKQYRMPRDSNFIDEILSLEIVGSELSDDDMAGYREKAEFYIRKHADEDVIKKLRTNEPLTDADIKELENLLWSEIGTREDYEAEFGSKPLGLFVREITGLDMNAAKQAFSKYLDESKLDSRQIYFVNQIIEYVVRNGAITDMSVLMESPFTDRGSLADIFTDLTVWRGIKSVIDDINEKAGL